MQNIKTAALVFCAVSALVLGWAVGPVLAQSYQFENVNVTGNMQVEDATVLRYAAVPTGAALTGSELNAAFQRLVGSGLFETVTLTPSGGRLTIDVVEYPIINVISFEGNARINDEKLATVISLASRQTYSPAKAEADAKALTEVYVQAGRVAASVKPQVIRRSGNRVDLVFEIAEGKVVEIERLAFVGNRNFSNGRLRQTLQTKQAGLLRQFVQRDTLVPDRIEFDKRLLKDFYTSRGYIDFSVLNASADLTRERDGYFVTFTVQEGLRYAFDKVQVISDIPEINAEDFSNLVSIKPGQVYNPLAIDLTMRRIESLTLQRSLQFVSVEPRIKRNFKKQTIDIDFTLVKAPRIFVERIDIKGNVTTLDRVIRRQFSSAESDPFNPRELRQAAERLRALGFFADAKVTTRNGSSDELILIDVDVVEKPTGSLGFGLSYSVTSGTGFNWKLSENNFLGRGQALSLNLSRGTTTTDAFVSFSESAFLGRDLRFSISGGTSSSSGNSASYDTDKLSFSPQISFPAGEMSRWSLEINLERTEISKVDDTNIILDADEGKVNDFSLGYSYTYDNRKSGLNPSGGVLLRFDQDFSGFSGDIAAVRTQVLAVAEKSVLNDAVSLRIIGEGGAYDRSNGDSLLTERFYARGKLRGFENNGFGPRDKNSPTDALGGNYFTSVRMESDFPIGIPEEYGITGGVFYDMASVWGLDNKTGAGVSNIVDDNFHLRSAAGLSIFWSTPIGPLRFNWSRALEKQSYDRVQDFDLTLSTQF
ncbi:MAG: outer membrane protein assembly factor BamA [Rhodobacter sp.]